MNDDFSQLLAMLGFMAFFLFCFLYPVYKSGKRIEEHERRVNAAKQ